ncbi:MAG: Pseudouridine synthase, RluA family [Candidatus Nomurabacteria bacterium GW2011_GWB1_40_7]|uniref:Pseudouridine synthase, RluA family n=1 Tax=Candidatus Nomurabacteria bacterium GW2011_GWB1_40_7 TaxID=1618744 RepID=A0A0G0SYV3_9BACT|nr:MAG: Pseudouridine synthase, RluA family [Candidatus Nomurabacteria bacterium GW2011_GWB1_40_7]
MKIKVLYEDSNILAIDKPSGILVHPDQKSKEKTILDLFLKKYPKIEIVHRLDKETSGVLLLAKNKKAHEFLKKQFSAPALGLKTKSGLADGQNRINKTYVAIVDGWVKNDRGVINKPIGRSPKDFRRHLAGRGVRGETREAVTQYRVLKRFEDTKGNKFTYLEVHPKTGRTHQIRVHMKYLNHPVACDSLYNPGKPCPKGFLRLALHAKSIEFKNLKGETIKVESLLPKEFEKLQK